MLFRSGAEKERVLNVALDRLLMPASLSGKAPAKLENTFAMAGGELLYLGKALQAVSIASGAQAVQLTAKGDAVVYQTADQRLFRAEAKNPGVPQPLSGERNFASFTITPNGRSVYFLTAEGQLFYLKGNKAPVMLKEGVHQLALDSKDTTVFMLCDFDGEAGELFTAKNGGKPKKMEGVGDAYGLYKSDCGLLVATNYSVDKGTATLFYATGGAALERVAYDVRVLAK